MSTLELVIGILLLVMAVFLVISVLMQSGKSKKLSGTIAGGAETFFGKQKGQEIDKRLSKITNVVSLVFVALVLSLLLLHAKETADKNRPSEDPNESSELVDEETDDDAASAETSDEASGDSEEASEEPSEENPGEVSETTEE